jgi:hypothetical protein
VAANGVFHVTTLKGATTMEAGRMPQHIAAVLSAAGNSLTVDEITHGVEARGVVSNASKGIKAIVSAALGRRDDLFVRVGRGKYDLAERHRHQNNTDGG